MAYCFSYQNPSRVQLFMKTNRFLYVFDRLKKFQKNERSFREKYIWDNLLVTHIIFLLVFSTYRLCSFLAGVWANDLF